MAETAVEVAKPSKKESEVRAKLPAQTFSELAESEQNFLKSEAGKAEKQRKALLPPPYPAGKGTNSLANELNAIADNQAATLKKLASDNTAQIQRLTSGNAVPGLVESGDQQRNLLRKLADEHTQSIQQLTSKESKPAPRQRDK
jgi:hypothetical protein